MVRSSDHPQSRRRKLAPRVFLAPLDDDEEVLEDTIVLPCVESPAFGDGSHPTTRLCSRAVDLFLRQHRAGPAHLTPRPMRMLDVGTGTGVLARIALAHGAVFVAGTDIDPVSLVDARRNLALGSRPARAPGPCTFEIDEVMPDFWGPTFDLVAANILEAPLLSLAPSIANAMAPGAVLFLSGFTRPQVPALKVAYRSAGLEVTLEATDGEWVLLQLSA